jgi:putative protease
MAKEKQIGKITHYFGQIGVGVIELSADLKIGEEIHIQGGERDFTQEVKSMQIEHQSIEKAKKGDAVGLKFEEGVKPGDRVYKVA